MEEVAAMDLVAQEEDRSEEALEPAVVPALPLLDQVVDCLEDTDLESPAVASEVVILEETSVVPADLMVAEEVTD